MPARTSPAAKRPPTAKVPAKAAKAPAKAIKAPPAAGSPPYTMRISRMTVDKLGVRLYDTVSAVVAELVANGHDADANAVTVSLPLASALATRKAPNAPWADAGYVIEVRDDGHGMTPDEARRNFLEVGRERRHHAADGQGAFSRHKKRPVMGRKGIGKLAPFGICRRIEVVSAGGERTRAGFLVSHFVMDYDRIVADSDAPVVLDRGALDRTYLPDSGTTIRLSQFLGKKVPDEPTFLRQLARRFAPNPGFAIRVVDTRPSADPARMPLTVGVLDVPLLDGTRVDLAAHPVPLEDGRTLPVQGWLALAREAYKNEETTGVRIYARKKIAGWTRDFEQPAGYTGEFTMRSYLVGEVIADWLDLDDGEDLVRTDRQGIIWDSEYGNALRKWGAGLIKAMGATSRAPRRKRVKDLFVARSDIEAQARARYTDPAVVKAALALADKIGGFAAEDELEDPDYVADLSDVILTVAPHTALMDAFRAFEAAAGKGHVGIAEVQTLFGKTRVAELASYGQIARERVQVIRQLEHIVFKDTNEVEFQRLIANAPWLVEPTWSVISENRSLATFKENFERWFQAKRGEDVVLAIRNESKRPDFTLVETGHRLHVVEIKASGHKFDDTDFDRFVVYLESFDEFFEQHAAVRAAFPSGYRITLVADGMALKVNKNARLFEADVERGKVQRVTWLDFLTRTKTAHEEFLNTQRTLDALGGPPAVVPPVLGGAAASP